MMFRALIVVQVAVISALCLSLWTLHLAIMAQNLFVARYALACFILSALLVVFSLRLSLSLARR